MDPTQIIMVLGAAGALLYVLNLIVGGKLHTSSETDGLRQDKTDLLKVNESQGKALKASNERDQEMISLLREVLQEVRQREVPNDDPS